MEFRGCTPLAQTASTGKCKLDDSRDKLLLEYSKSRGASAGGACTSFCEPTNLQLRTRGIPALHWTIVHSQFGNKDRRYHKSFSSPARQLASITQRTRVLPSSALTKGLFDPTITSDQLQADERFWSMQQRQRSKTNAHKTQSFQEGRFSSPQSVERLCAGKAEGWKARPVKNSPTYYGRESSLTSLLLSGPTLREILEHHAMANDDASHASRKL